MSDSNSTTTEQYIGVWALPSRAAAGEAAPLAPGASISQHPPLDMDMYEYGEGGRLEHTSVCIRAGRQACVRTNLCVHTATVEVGVVLLRLVFME